MQSNPLSDLAFDRPPALIGGCGRSGTSLLLAVLSAHPGLAAIPQETEAFCPGIWDNAYDPAAGSDWPVIAAHFRDNPPPTTARRFVEKTPKNVVALGRILDEMGSEVRFLNIVRDGRDVITSRHPTRRRDRFWVSPERWINDVAAGAPFDDHPQVMVIRYEDLVRDFETSIRTICDFLDEEPVREIIDWHDHATVRSHAAWSGQVKPIFTKSIGRWKQPEYTDLMTDFLARPRAEELLRRYGYLD